MRVYTYVGSQDIYEKVKGHPPGKAIRSIADLKEWLFSQADYVETDGNVWATYVVKEDLVLYLAPRRSEHVACAAGGSVVAAGEMSFSPVKGELLTCTNQSLGYCPDVDCWKEVESALDYAKIEHEGCFTDEYIIRRCPKCNQKNIVKDGLFECGSCWSELPNEWNFDS